jgi:hypothetical protein
MLSRSVPGRLMARRQPLELVIKVRVLARQSEPIPGAEIV